MASRKSTADKILRGFQHAGFIYLNNHGIPADIISRAFSQSADFFARSEAQKDCLAWTTPEANRGYSCMGREKTTTLTDKASVEKLRDSNPDLKETFEIGRDGEPGMPNPWPDQFDEKGRDFTRDMRSFFATCKNLHTQVMRAMALGLGIDENWFDPFTSTGDNTLRLLHYPQVKKDVFKQKKGQVRAGAHSDYGSITLLFQDQRGGLQVQSPSGTFVDARPIAGTIVVNAGDLLARWSNDTIKSTIHRVVEPPAPMEEPGDTHQARYSIAYFCNPDFEKFIDAIPGTIGTSEVKKYEGINSGQYLVQRLTATY